MEQELQSWEQDEDLAEASVMAAAQAGAINCRTTTWFVGELSRAAYGKVMRPELQKQFRQG